MAKRNSLTDALTKSAKGHDTVVSSPKNGADHGGPKPIGASIQAKPGRVGKVNITGYFDPAVKKSIRLIQAHDPTLTVQDLLAEALNDLFAKYNVPQTAYVGEGEGRRAS